MSLDPLLNRQLPTLSRFSKRLSAFSSSLSKTDHELTNITNQKQAEFSHWHAILRTDLDQLDSQIHHLQSDISDERARLSAVARALHNDRATASRLQASCAELQFECDAHSAKLRQLKDGHCSQLACVIARSVRYATEIELDGEVFGQVLSWLDLRSLIGLLRVCHGYRQAVLSWHGWMPVTRARAYRHVLNWKLVRQHWLETSSLLRSGREYTIK